jgi:beta-lactam-binding protein with PASTA domain
MNVKDFMGKLFSRYLIGHLAAMALVVLLLCIGVKYGLAVYTHHNEGIVVPDLKGTDYAKAIEQLGEQGITVVANDTGYNKRMPANCILTQTPGEGTKVKEGRTIYVTINSSSSPKVSIPDLIDNSSYREAQARLTAIGFRLTEPKRIDGERDWVYGITDGGRNLQAGDKVSIESMLTLVIGNGLYEEEEEEDDMMLDVPQTGSTEKDDFEEVVE